MVNLDMIPVPGDSFCVREIGEETIFLAESGDELHCLDEVGTFIWKAIDGQRSLADILDRVCDEYEVSREAAQRDLTRFIRELAEKGIVTLKGGQP